jgi:acetylornithine deacetylase/succinyl-diaminopimelate desuccinylase-like protein
MSAEESTIFKRPAEILQRLIRFDTTNPPGNEAACIAYIADLLKSVGLESQIYVKEEPRHNLLCRLKGKGEAPPLLLYGHVDVVTTAGQPWRHDPFGGEIVDGYVWGRGALDMKGELTMFLSAFMRLKVEGIQPAGDILFMALSDEENDGVFGAEYMVSEHAELFEGVKYALGEFGGFNMDFLGRRFYPIQVSEKQICKLELTIRGASGHGATMIPGNTMEELGKVLARISKQRLPVHITPVAREMIGAIGANLGFPLNQALKLLMVPAFTDRFLALIGSNGLLFTPLLHNTVNPTIVSGGEKDNVVPSEVKLRLDGRLLPGFSPAELVKELAALLEGIDVAIQLVRYQEGPSEVDMGLFPFLEGILKELDPEGIPIPLLLTAVTDGRHLAKIGIQSYGFTPLQMAPGESFLAGVHGVNERIPIKALEFGSEAVFRVLKQYQG